MNNTIDTSNIIKTVISESKKTLTDEQNQSTSQPTATATGNLADTVSITDAAKQLASAEKIDSNNMPIHDSKKLDAIKQEIANGTYQIDSKAIANKLIEFE